MSRRTESKRAERWQKTGRRDKQAESDRARAIAYAHQIGCPYEADEFG